MGFNKRYINKDLLIQKKNEGLDSLIEFIKSADCIICDDEFSDKICDIVRDSEYMNLFDRLCKIGYYNKNL
jgi:hypothetical protein